MTEHPQHAALSRLILLSEANLAVLAEEQRMHQERETAIAAAGIDRDTLFAAIDTDIQADHDTLLDDTTLTTGQQSAALETLHTQAQNIRRRLAHHRQNLQTLDAIETAHTLPWHL